MVIRIVHMHFKDSGVEEFLQIFNKHKEAIRNFEGCMHLELLRDVHDRNVFTTLSHWRDENSLEHYRQSTLFNAVWRKVKLLFAERARAYSLNRHIEV